MRDNGYNILKPKEISVFSIFKKNDSLYMKLSD